MITVTVILVLLTLLVATDADSGAVHPSAGGNLSPDAL